jgi:hypothetical protein
MTCACKPGDPCLFHEVSCITCFGRCQGHGVNAQVPRSRPEQRPIEHLVGCVSGPEEHPSTCDSGCPWAATVLARAFYNKITRGG